MNTFEICRCSCHDNPNMVHCMPCCYTCEICGQNILTGFYESHIEECKKEYEESKKWLKEQLEDMKIDQEYADLTEEEKQLKDRIDELDSTIGVLEQERYNIGL